MGIKREMENFSHVSCSENPPNRSSDHCIGVRALSLSFKYALSNEVEIPKLGLGTWFIPDDQTAEAVNINDLLGHIVNVRGIGYKFDAGI